MNRVDSARRPRNVYLNQSGEGYVSVSSGRYLRSKWDTLLNWDMFADSINQIQLASRQLGPYQEEYNERIQPLRDELNGIRDQWKDIGRQSRQSGIIGMFGFLPEPDSEQSQQLTQRTNDIHRQMDDIYRQYLELAEQEDIVMTADELNADYGNIMQFEESMSRDRAEYMVDRRREQMQRQFYQQNGPQNAAVRFAGGAAGLISGMLDPLELAAAFVPVVGPVRYARMIKRFGKVGGRVASGSIEGAVGGIITEPLNFLRSRNQQIDYTFYDALLNVGMGAMFGAGIGFIRGKISKRTPEQILEDAGYPREFLTHVDTYRTNSNIAIRQGITKGVVRLPEESTDIRTQIPYSSYGGKKYTTITNLPEEIKEELQPRFVLTSRKNIIKEYKREGSAKRYAESIDGQVKQLPNGNFIVEKQIPGEIVRQLDGQVMFFKTRKSAETLILKQQTSFLDPETNINAAQIIPVNTAKGRRFIIGMNIDEANAKLITNQMHGSGLKIREGINLKRSPRIKNQDKKSINNVLYDEDSQIAMADELVKYTEQEPVEKNIVDLDERYTPENIEADIAKDIETIGNDYDVIYKTLTDDKFMNNSVYKNYAENLQQIVDNIDAFENALPNATAIAVDGIYRNDPDTLTRMYENFKEETLDGRKKNHLKNIYDELNALADDRERSNLLQEDLRIRGLEIENILKANIAKDKYNYIDGFMKVYDMVNRGIKSATDQNNPLEYIEHLIVGTSKKIEGSGINVDQLKKDLSIQRSYKFNKKLEDNNLLDLYSTLTPEQNKLVYEVIHGVNRKIPLTKQELNVSDEIFSLGKLLADEFEINRTRLNNKGASIPKLDGFAGSINYRIGKITKAGNEQFTTDLRNALDFDELNVKANDIDEFVQSTYTSITSGVRKETPDYIDEPLNSVFQTTRNYARALHKNRLLVFKSATDQYEFLQKYTESVSIKDIIDNDIAKTSRAESVLRLMGANPEYNLKKSLNILQELYRDKPELLKPIQKALKRERGMKIGVNVFNYLRQVTGESSIPENQTVADVFAFLRGLISFQALGGAGWTALNDVPSVLANQKSIGIKIGERWGQTINQSLKRLPKELHKEYGILQQVAAENMNGGILTKLGLDTDNYSGYMKRGLDFFFTVNGLKFVTQTAKSTFVKVLSAHMGYHSGKGFASLPKDLKIILKKYDIDESNWQYIRQAGIKDPSGINYIMPEMIDNLAISNELKENLQLKLIALFDSEADIASPTPGAKEQVMLTLGTIPGTPLGEAVRTITQFKSFPLTIMTKAFNRQLRPDESGKRTPKGYQNVAALMTTMLAYSYFNVQGQELAKGRTLRAEIDGKLFIDMVSRSGILGLYNDILIQQGQLYGVDLLTTLAGPGLSKGAQALELFGEDFFSALGIIDPKPESYWRRRIQFGKEQLPFQNLIYTKALLDYLVWYRILESVDPGYLRRMEQRMTRETGQDYWYKSPADHVLYID